MAGTIAGAATGAPMVRARPRDMSLRDWATFLLHSAAEVEHALMVQYLFAMYSLNPNATGPKANDPTASINTSSWARTLRKIAIEEMSHLLIVAEYFEVYWCTVEFRTRGLSSPRRRLSLSL